MIPTEKTMARAAITAGLSAMMALGTSIPALASDKASNAKGVTDTPTVGESANPEYENQVTGESRGDTKLYIISQQDDLTTSEGAADENVKVSIPVAIHYVADSEGNLTGPSDNVVKFVNHTITGPVHVSKIGVDANGSDADISLMKDVSTMNDRMGFTITPVQGQSNDSGSVFVPASQFSNENYKDVSENGETLTGTGAAAVYDHRNADRSAPVPFSGGHDGDASHKDELGYYSTTSTGQNHKADKGLMDPRNVDDWNIVQKNGALGLNDLKGKIGGFDKINAGTDYQAGAIHWVVRAGTRAQATEKDCTLTLRYNANTGERAEGAEGDTALMKDQKTQILTYTAATTDHAASYSYDSATAADTDLKADGAVTAPKQVTNSDGTVSTWTFRGWSLDPHAGEEGNSSTIFETKENNFNVDAVVQAKAPGAETSLKNGVLQLYAIYSKSTTKVDGNQG